jgi:hypothetical protein
MRPIISLMTWSPTHSSGLFGSKIICDRIQGQRATYQNIVNKQDVITQSRPLDTESESALILAAVTVCACWIG